MPDPRHIIRYDLETALRMIGEDVGDLSDDGNIYEGSLDEEMRDSIDFDVVTTSPYGSAKRPCLHNSLGAGTCTKETKRRARS